MKGVPVVGDWVKLSPESENDYEVAEIRQFPHGPMVGIYDEPPSKHVDFWNASSLTLSRRRPAKGSAPVARCP
jgi:hypothetical protein